MSANIAGKPRAFVPYLRPEGPGASAGRATRSRPRATRTSSWPDRSGEDRCLRLSGRARRRRAERGARWSGQPALSQTRPSGVVPDGRISMASIRKEIPLAVSAEHAWAAVRDIGALHYRLVPGFVVDTRLEADARVVTFGNGMVVRELIVDLNDEALRFAWSARGGRLSHHNASAQVFADGEGRCWLVWIADLLPNELTDDIRAMIEQAAAVMKVTLESQRPGG